MSFDLVILDACNCGVVVGTHAHMDEHTTIPWSEVNPDHDPFATHFSGLKPRYPMKDRDESRPPNPTVTIRTPHGEEEVELAPTEPQEEPIMCHGQLIKEGLDANGDYFSREALQAMVDKARPQIERGAMFATEGFKRDIEFIQGTVETLTTEGDTPNTVFSVGCSVKILDTPAGKRLKCILDRNRMLAERGIEVEAMEPALMGRGTPDVVDGVKTYKDLEMIGASIIPAKDKVR